MKEWKELSESALSTMQFLGNFGPTVHANQREVKGYMYDDEGGGKVYLCSGELKTMAADLTEVAAWLDERAEKKS